MQKLRFVAVMLNLTFVVAASSATELPKNASPVLVALSAELDRSLTTFKTQPVPAYFLGYQAIERHAFSVTASFGALQYSNESRTRQFDIDLRVGDYALDNTHPLRGEGRASSPGSHALPVEDDIAAVRAAVWYHTDRRYKASVEQLDKAKSDVQVNVAEEDKSPDFCAAPVEVFVETPRDVTLDRAAWETRLRLYTEPFSAYGNIYSAQASVNVEAQTRWYVDSGGTLLQTTQTSARLMISASTKAEDGMVLPRYETWFAFTPDQLPSDKVVQAAVAKMIAQLQALRTAPMMDPYTGPAILSGRAAGVFFHEVFGHRVEGHRQKRAEEGQTFKKMLGQPVLPPTFTVYSDPTLKNLGPVALGGHYLYDDQGVKARRVNLVEAGVFKGFLMARMPIDGFPASNGHGRKSPGNAVVARQANLMIEVAQTVSREQLKKELLRLIAEQQKPYGLFFEDIEGGFTITSRNIPNSFNVRPLVVYRVYPDGREELVRGVDFIGTPLSTFSKVVAADDTPDIFNGTCGAESGWVPVSAVSPGLLISQVEVQKKDKSQDRLPLLPAPTKPAVQPTTAK